MRLSPGKTKIDFLIAPLSLQLSGPVTQSPADLVPPSLSPQITKEEKAVRTQNPLTELQPPPAGLAEVSVTTTRLLLLHLLEDKRIREYL